MGKSVRKTKIFGNSGRSEKQDKRINNRMFRRKESTIGNTIKQELTEENINFVWSEENESVDTETKYPIDMNEIRNVWAMSKDGKSYWHDAPDKSMRK